MGNSKWDLSQDLLAGKNNCHALISNYGVVYCNFNYIVIPASILSDCGINSKIGSQYILTYLSSTLTMMAIGNGFALLSRKWKWIVGIGGPVIVFICLFYLGMAAVHLGVESLLDNNLFINIMLSTTTWWIVLLIYLLIMLVLTKAFSDRLQLRRD